MDEAWKPILATEPSCRGQELALSCSPEPCPRDCCGRSWPQTGSRYKSPRPAEPGVDKRAAATGRRGKADDVIWLFPPLLSGSPGPWGWHLPSLPHPHPRLDFSLMQALGICARPLGQDCSPACSPPSGFPHCPSCTFSLSLSLSHFHYIYSDWLQFCKTETTAIYHCTSHISLRPVQQVLVPRSETSKHDSHRS